MISDEERSNSLIIAKKSPSLTDQCKRRLGLSAERSSKQYRRIRQAIKYSCEGMIPIYTDSYQDIIPFTRPWSSHKRGTRCKAINKAVESVSVFVFLGMPFN